MAATARTINYDALLTTTLDKARKVVVDNIFLANPFIAWMYMRDRVDYQDGGNNILVPVMYGKNDTVKSFSGYDTFNTAPQDGITNAIYPWRGVGGTISISTEEEAKNNGDAAILKLMKTKIDQAQMSMKEDLNRQAFLDGTGNGGKDIFGLNLLVEDGTAWLSSVAGIDRTTEAWWRNQWTGAVGSFAAGGVDAMRTLYNNCSKGNLHPDLVLSTQAIYEYYEKTLASNERFFNTEVGDAGFQNLLFKASVFMYDAYCPSQTLFMLTSQHLKLMVHSSYDLVTTKFVEPSDQAARVAKLLWFGNIVMDNAARQGRLDAITA